MSKAEEGVQDLRATMLRKKFFMIKTYVDAPREEVEKYLREHLLMQIELERRGVLFAAGPVTDKDGNFEHGMFILRVNSMEEAQAIADNDPMHKAGVRRYTLHRWSMNEGCIDI